MGGWGTEEEETRCYAYGLGDYEAGWGVSGEGLGWHVWGEDSWIGYEEETESFWIYRGSLWLGEWLPDT